MNKFLPVTAACAALLFSMAAAASKPVSITWESDGTTPDGTAYSSYGVRCANGQNVPLTAWDGRKKWCVGAQSTENCHKKQIKAAKEACKA